MIREIMEAAGLVATSGKDVFIGGGRFLQANEFNAGYQPRETKLYYRPDSVITGPEFGWTADYSEVLDQLNPGVKGAPSCIVGWKPWQVNSSTPDFPIQLKTLTDVAVSASCDWQAEGDGAYKATWDFWITSGGKPSKETITGEVMVSLFAQDMRPAGMLVSESIPGTYLNGKRYYADPSGNRPWPIHTFVLDPVTNGNIQDVSIPIGSLLYALTRKQDDPHPVDPDHWLADAEIMTEIESGRVAFVANRHSVTVRKYQ